MLVAGKSVCRVVLKAETFTLLIKINSFAIAITIINTRERDNDMLHTYGPSTNHVVKILSILTPLRGHFTK